ncbi:hypothetical protein COY95_00145, partial [Candidatus Woesearchaeota archaeon CG_4_10_14_0_8_um_filter_47_5]
MYTDLCFPENNEEEYIALAKTLGWHSLCCAYSMKTKQAIQTRQAQLTALAQKKKIPLFLGIVADKPSHLLHEQSCLVISRSSPATARTLLETSALDLVYDLENDSKKDPLHFRRSGLNQVLCALARKNNIAVGFAFSSLLSTENRPERMGRIMQNIRLGRKFKLYMVVASFARKPSEMRAPRDLMSLAVSLGMRLPEAHLAL